MVRSYAADDFLRSDSPRKGHINRGCLLFCYYQVMIALRQSLIHPNNVLES